MNKKDCFRNFKRIGIAAGLAVTAVLFVGCSDGNSGSPDNNRSDTDGDGIIDANDRCVMGVGAATTPTSWTSNAATDADQDGCRDSDEDIDDDNDGLIEIYTLAQLNNMRHNLAGTGYQETSNTTPITVGAPTTPTAHCGTAVDGHYLCGYELMSNLDFDVDNDGSTWDSATRALDSADHNEEYFPIASEAGGWLPIGDNANRFNAIFEGNNHTISNLAIRRAQFGSGLFSYGIGLFGDIDTAAHIRNIGLLNYLADYTGTQTSRIGGLAGYSRGTIVASYAAGRIEGGTITDQVGGLVGRNVEGIIIASYATGKVNGSAGNDYVGGLVGLQDGGSITASYAAVGVDGGDDDDFVGGLVGQLSSGSIGTITASYAAGGVDGGNGDDDVGGLVGWQNNGTIRASYATGGADGGAGDDNDNVGGLVGTHYNGTITASYAIGRTNGGDGDGDNVGSLVGTNSSGFGTITASYGFGSVEGKETDGISPSLPPGVTTSTHLTEATAGSCDPTNTALTQKACAEATGTNTWTSWNAESEGLNAWDFGNDTHAPALRFADYDGPSGTNNIDYCGTARPSTFADGSAITCGPNGTLLPGQGR